VDIQIMIGASALLLVMALDGVIERLDGIVLFGILVCFVVWTLRSAPRVNGKSADVEDSDRSAEGSPERPGQEQGQPISTDALQLDIPILLAAAFACLPFVFWDHKLDRWEGGVFVGYYFAYVVFLVLDGTGHRASHPFAFVMLVFVIPLTALTLAVAVVRHRRHALTTVTTTSARGSADRMESLE